MKKFDKLDLEDDAKINGGDDNIEEGEDAAEVSKDYLLSGVAAKKINFWTRVESELLFLVFSQ